MSTTDHFTAHRNLLFTVAYEMLGSAADAEDVVQEVWLRWADGDRDDVLDPRAYLVRITTRLALNKLRANARRREDYVGTWLPEPVLTAPDVAQDVELADSVSTAMLLVLETMPPLPMRSTPWLYSAQRSGRMRSPTTPRGSSMASHSTSTGIGAS